MHFHEVDIPDSLVSASYSGSLVVFAGAGVSMQDPVNFPSFDKLVANIKDQVDPASRLRGRKQKKLPNNGTVYTETPEQYLSYLESKAGNVRQACCSTLPKEGKTSELHRNILRLFPNSIPTKIVTTNFDDCFEVAFKESGRICNVYSSPALPYGDSFCGLAHIHGSVENPDSIILLAEDYGKSYVTNGWASRFLVDLFEKHVVLFIGYSYSDSLVDYLTRSISSHIGGKAYALCKANENDSDWLARGITPISFSDYSDLPIIIGDWATYLEQSVTERVCKLREIAEHSALNEHEKEYLLHSLNWHNDDDQSLFAREFCDASSSFEHLVFLEKSGNAAFLTNESPSDTDCELLQWTISNFAINNCSELQQLCASIRSKLSMSFYDRLLSQFLLTDAPANTIGPWIAWLESMPSQYHSHCSYALSELADKCLAPEIFFAITRMLLRIGLVDSERIFGRVSQEPAVAINDEYYRDKVLEGLERHREAIGVKVFDYCFLQIELAYSIQTGCWTNPDAFDNMSYARSSVEPHTQDLYSNGPGSILLDVIRESVDAASAQHAIRKCLDSNCTILIRLGLWLTNEYSCSGKSLDLIQTMNLLSDPLLHHETFQLIRSSFALATEKQRLDFVRYLRTYFASKDDSDYECFNVCVWILESTPNDQISKLKAEILERNQNFLPREHPDFLYYISSGFVKNEAACRIDEKAFKIEEMISRLNAPLEPGTFITKLDIVSKPCRDYPMVALRMIRELLSQERTEDKTLLCNLLIKAIDWNSPCITQHDVCALFVDILSQRDLCIEGIKTLASVSISADKTIKWISSDLSMMLAAASRYTNEYLNAEPAIQPGDNPDWLLIGLNHPAGKYLQMIAELDQIHFKETGGHSGDARKLLVNLDPATMNESTGSKALIAYYFKYLNLWIEVDKEYAQASANILAVDDWAFIPAWQ